MDAVKVGIGPGSHLHHPRRGRRRACRRSPRWTTAPARRDRHGVPDHLRRRHQVLGRHREGDRRGREHGDDRLALRRHRGGAGRGRSCTRAAATRATAAWARSGAMKQGAKDRYFQADVEERAKLVPEGIEGRVPYKGTPGDERVPAGRRPPQRHGLHRLRAPSRSCGRRRTFVRITSGGLTREPRPRRHHHRGGAELPRGVTAVPRRTSEHVHIHAEKVLILDFGSQYTQLIARRVRELGVYCEIHRPDLPRGRHPRLRAPRASSSPAARPRSRPRAAPLRPRGLRAGRAGARHLLRAAADGQDARRQGRPDAPTASTARRRSRCSTRAGLFARFKKGESRQGLDEPRRPGRRAPAGLRAHRPDRELAASRPRRTRASPSTGSSSTPRWSTPRGARRCSGPSSSTTARCSGTWTMKGFAEEAESRPSASRWARGRVICGAVGRRGQLGGGAAHPPRDRRSAAVHLRRQRAAARRASASRSRRSSRTASTCRCRPSTPGRASSTSSRASPTRRRSGRSSAASSSRSSRRRRARSQDADFLAQGTLYPDVIESVSHQGPVRHHQEPPQRGRAARADEAQAGRAAARAVQGRGPRARPRAGAAGRDGRRGSRSPGPGWPSACSARSPRSGWSWCARPTPSSRRRSANAGLYGRSGRRSRCCCPVQSVGVMGDERTYESTCGAARGDQRGRDDRGLGAAAVRAAGADLHAGSPTRCAASTASSTTSPRKPPATIEWE